MDLREGNHLVSRFGAAGAQRLAAFALAAGVSGLLLGCAGGSGPTDAYKRLTTVDYGKPYIGMSKAEVLKCAGQPRSVVPASGGGETLVYRYNGAGPVPVSGDTKDKKNKKDKKDKKDKKSSVFGNATNSADGDCTASLTFQNGTLARVYYAHKDARSPYQWQSEKDPKKAEQMRNEEGPTCTFSLPRCPR
jgi:hypothetical protein